MLGRILLPAALVLGIWVYMNAPQSKAATAVVTQACSAAAPGAATVTLAWPGAKAGAQETWLDLGLARGLPAGSFQSRGPLQPSQTAYALDGVPPGLTYYYRVNTIYPDGWHPSAAGSFVSKCSK
ncbi:MAG TPA: hypothetical protein VEZ14_01775 [Dehalococcoidia bacterium]|nr:hypothetical protein [Dehalococcoidia bacterium]